jgi:peptidoglycan/xylan/chitin deacetylase (PgdA/CDA1 family)
VGVPRRQVLQAGLCAGLLSACGQQVLRTAPTPVAVPVNLPRPGNRATTDLPKNKPAATHPTNAPAVEFVHAARDVQQVALTFQGSGDPRLARALLQEAERAHVKVTVLAVGQWLLAHPFIAHRILHGGNELGNQTYSHPVDMARLSPDAAYEEIARCAAVLRKLTGSPGTWFRPTGTPHANRTILTAAGRAGYARCLSYDVETFDWTDPGSARIVQNTITKVRAGSVISMHLGHAGTVAALPQILDHLRERGLTPVTAGELFGTA